MIKQLEKRLNFKSDNPEEGILMRWSLAASTFFSNWINYAVYQETPYLLEELIRNKELEEFNDLY